VPILEKTLRDGKKLLDDPKLPKHAHDAWELGTRHWLEKAFGHGASEVSQVMNAGPSGRVMRAGDPGIDAIRLHERNETLKAQLSRLEGALGILRMQASLLPNATTDGETSPMSAPLDLFVSQTERDEPLVKALLDLIDKALKIPNDRIRCTSIAGNKLRGDADVSETLRDEIKHCSVFLAVLTEASNESFYVASEIGARWSDRGTAGCRNRPRPEAARVEKSSAFGSF
jgi:hypothetical protein